MPAWSEARRLASAIRSSAAKKDGADDDNPAVEMLRKWFALRYKHYKPASSRCIFSGKECAGKVTTGYVAGFGALWKCARHETEYVEIKSALEEVQ